MTAPTVSVIVPNYNHAPYLRERIESILNQTYRDFELILLDDCSSDNSRDILNAYAGNEHVSHIVFNERNSGSTFRQWEKGLELAGGRYVWIAESDDYASPEFLETVIPALEQADTVVMAFTGSFMVGPDGGMLDDDWDRFRPSMPASSGYRSDVFLERMLWDNPVYNASMVVFRKDCFQKVGTAYQSFRYCGDWYFWSEIARQGDVVSINRKLNYFRQHDSKVSPGALKEGLYFFEGEKVILHLMEVLHLSALQRMVVRGRQWRKLRVNVKRNPELRNTVPAGFPGIFRQCRLSVFLYELDKYLHFSRLHKR